MTPNLDIFIFLYSEYANNSRGMTSIKKSVKAKYFSGQSPLSLSSRKGLIFKTRAVLTKTKHKSTSKQKKEKPNPSETGTTSNSLLIQSATESVEFRLFPRADRKRSRQFRTFRTTTVYKHPILYYKTTAVQYGVPKVKKKQNKNELN